MSGIVGGAGSKSGVIGQTELDYEEGTWTPTNNGDSSLTVSSESTGNYVKVGNLVTLHFLLTYSTTNGTAGWGMGGIPFDAVDLAGTSLENGGIFSYWSAASQNMASFYPYIETAGVMRCFFSTGGGSSTMSSLANDYINSNFSCRGTITYRSST